MVVVVSDEGDLEWVKFALFGGKVGRTRQSWRRSKYSGPSSQAAVSPSRKAVDRYQAASFKYLLSTNGGGTGILSAAAGSPGASSQSIA